MSYSKENKRGSTFEYRDMKGRLNNEFISGQEPVKRTTKIRQKDSMANFKDVRKK